MKGSDFYNFFCYKFLSFPASYLWQFLHLFLFKFSQDAPISKDLEADQVKKEIVSLTFVYLSKLIVFLHSVPT